MKRFLNLLQPHLVKPILYSVILKFVLGICFALCWNLYVNTKSTVSLLIIKNCIFFLAVYFFIWTWLQYLAFDGFYPFSILHQKGTENGNPASGFHLQDLINQNVDAFVELDEEEQTVTRLCANFIVGVLYLVLYCIFSII